MRPEPEPKLASALTLEASDALSLALNAPKTSRQAILGGLAHRMAAAARDDDAALLHKQKPTKAKAPRTPTKKEKKQAKRRASELKDTAGGVGFSRKKEGWLYTTRPDVAVEALVEVASLGSGSFGVVRMVLHEATNEVGRTY